MAVFDNLDSGSRSSRPVTPPPIPDNKIGKGLRVGWPGAALINQWAYFVEKIFDDEAGIYIVGSSTKTRDWFDIDIVAILDDEKFNAMFPKGGSGFDSKWESMCIAISTWGTKVTGLPIDFKIQSKTRANKIDGERYPIGNYYND